jgi:hypothetical protein
MKVHDLREDRPASVQTPRGGRGPSRVADSSQVDLAFAERRQLFVCGFSFERLVKDARCIVPAEQLAHAISDP